MIDPLTKEYFASDEKPIQEITLEPGEYPDMVFINGSLQLPRHDYKYDSPMNSILFLNIVRSTVARRYGFILRVFGGYKDIKKDSVIQIKLRKFW